VIVPTNTFLATAFAVMHAGNQVIFADADPKTLCLDVEDVARRLRPDTAAVILVHIGGVITPAVHELQRLCRDRNLCLIEDCAHAHGCSIDGQQAGTLGIAGGFSFFPTKVLTSGEGGMVTTNDEALAHCIRMLRNHGKNPDLGNRMSEFGHNHRMSELTALLGVQQLSKADVLITDRRRAAAFYDSALSSTPGIHPVCLPDNVFSTFYKYICYVDERFARTTVKHRLREVYGVSLPGEVYAELCHTEPLWESYTYCGARRSEPIQCHRWPGCGCDQRQQDYPGAEYLARHHICLPLYPGLSEVELGYVVDSLRQTLSELGGR
jgi:dTDP-4-amino-4,6-dideoxygalactose transaminase